MTARSWAQVLELRQPPQTTRHVGSGSCAGSLRADQRARLSHCLLEPLVFLSLSASCPKRRSHGQKTRYIWVPPWVGPSVTSKRKWFALSTAAHAAKPWGFLYKGRCPGPAGPGVQGVENTELPQSPGIPFRGLVLALGHQALSRLLLFYHANETCRPLHLLGF